MIRWYLEKQPWADGVSLHCLKRDGGIKAIATDVTFVEDNITGLVTPPMLQIDGQSAQSLMDQLWNCGFRPSEGSGSAGALAATQDHLRDMQRIIFGD